MAGRALLRSGTAAAAPLPAGSVPPVRERGTSAPHTLGRGRPLEEFSRSRKLGAGRAPRRTRLVAAPKRTRVFRPEKVGAWSVVASTSSLVWKGRATRHRRAQDGRSTMEAPPGCGSRRRRALRRGVRNSCALVAHRAGRPEVAGGERRRCENPGRRSALERSKVVRSQYSSALKSLVFSPARPSLIHTG